jgi:hypothetical protein
MFWDTRVVQYSFVKGTFGYWNDPIEITRTVNGDLPPKTGVAVPTHLLLIASPNVRSCGGVRVPDDGL